MPKAPYRIERVPGAPPSRLRIVRGERSEVIDMGDAEAIERAAELLDISQGEPRPSWRIETDAMSCAWPAGFALCSDPDELSPFVLFGADDAMIWIAGPVERAKVTPIEELADEGQTIRAVAQAGERERMDLDYVVDGEPWWQRKYVMPWGTDEALVLTGQARMRGEENTSAAVDAIEATIERVYWA